MVEAPERWACEACFDTFLQADGETPCPCQDSRLPRMVRDLKRQIAELRAERDEARGIVRDIHWMAVRYADNRKSYAVGMCNDALRKAYDGGWLVYQDGRQNDIDPQYARDGMFDVEWRSAVDSATARAEAAEAENARLRALPLKDEVERVLSAAWEVVDACAGDNKPAIGWAREVRSSMDALLSRLRAEEQEGWRPIETAPKDGSQIDLWCRSPGISGGGYARTPDCWYSSGRWWRYDENGDDQCREKVHNVTHWMPRPAAPSEQGGDRG